MLSRRLSRLQKFQDSHLLSLRWTRSLSTLNPDGPFCPHGDRLEVAFETVVKGQCNYLVGYGFLAYPVGILGKCSWGNSASVCRSANRLSMSTSNSADSISFRVAMSPSSQTNNPTPVELPGSADSIGIKFKLISAGTFTMGKGDEAHDVTLTKSFQMGVHEVTQEQYEKVMGVNPSIFAWVNPVIYECSDNPVDSMTWDDATEFCRRLSALPAEKPAGNVYRLPTEAEWEFACRAGTTRDSSFVDDRSVLGHYAWYHANSEKTTHPVSGTLHDPWGPYEKNPNTGAF